MGNLSLYGRDDTLARRNYNYEKRQKELKKQKKREEKRKRKLEKNKGAQVENAEETREEAPPE